MSEHTHEWRCPEVTWGDAPRYIVAVCEDCHLEAVYIPEARLAEAEADAGRLAAEFKVGVPLARGRRPSITSPSCP